MRFNGGLDTLIVTLFRRFHMRSLLFAFLCEVGDGFLMLGSMCQRAEWVYCAAFCMPWWNIGGCWVSFAQWHRHGLDHEGGASVNAGWRQNGNPAVRVSACEGWNCADSVDLCVSIDMWSIYSVMPLAPRRHWSPGNVVLVLHVVLPLLVSWLSVFRAFFTAMRSSFRMMIF